MTLIVTTTAITDKTFQPFRIQSLASTMTWVGPGNFLPMPLYISVKVGTTLVSMP